jgi:hypothetical protein
MNTSKNPTATPDDSVWKQLTNLPSAWLLLVQLFILILSPLSLNNQASNAISWCLSTLALLLVGTIIKKSPIYTAFGLVFVVLGISLSSAILIGYSTPAIQTAANLVDAIAYFYGAAGLVMYMFEDEFLTRDELFAAAAVFTLLAWGFAFLYSVCQLWFPGSFHPTASESRTWLELIFLSFSIQSGTGLSDFTPLTPPARVLAALQMFCSVMYIALVVSRNVALHYVAHLPKNKGRGSDHKSDGR